jgi:3'-5' exoribonuclease
MRTQTSLTDYLAIKRKFVKDLQFKEELTGEQFVLKSLRRGKTSDGRDYMDVVLLDRTGEIIGKVWEDSLSECQSVSEGDVVNVSGTVLEFRDKQQIKVSAMVKAQEFDLADFLPKTEKDMAILWKKIRKTIDSVADADIKNLLELIFGESDFENRFKIAPGAERLHHAYIGGLMEHVVEMIEIYMAVGNAYPKLDKNLMIAGILLHDIGKMQELSMSHAISRTLEGNLLGHISLGLIYVDKYVDRLENFPKELRIKVLHLIASHHGELAYGSPVKPMMTEAMALHYIDVLSAKIRIAERIKDENVNSGQDFTEKNYSLDTKLYLK